MNPYAASKAALNMMNRALAGDLKERGVISVVMNPGWVRTNMGGEKAKLSPEESVGGMLSTLLLTLLVLRPLPRVVPALVLLPTLVAIALLPAWTPDGKTLYVCNRFDNDRGDCVTKIFAPPIQFFEREFANRGIRIFTRDAQNNRHTQIVLFK